MAHSCPDCGSTCYCCGDIDDIDFGETFAGCTCCLHEDKREDDYEAYDDYEPEIPYPTSTGWDYPGGDKDDGYDGEGRH
jgi:hypothetical protein